MASSPRFDKPFRQTTNQGKLSSEDFIELTRISRRKHDIERHVADLQNWPSWDPFKEISSFSTNVDCIKRNREVLDAIGSDLRDRRDKCNCLERDVQQFNVEDMKRLRTVAKAISKRHLSGQDTDLLELALETVYALDKLLRLLREQRTLHDLTELRLEWEQLICSSWEDVVLLRRDIDAFENKCKTLLVPRIDGGCASASDTGTVQVQTSQEVQRSSRERSSASLTASSKLAAESVKLEASRLVLRIRSFDTEKVRPAGRLLDLLIDQRQVPEKMIDEQEKLEEALPQPAAIEARASQLFAESDQVNLSTPEVMRGDESPTTEPAIASSSPTSEAMERASSQTPSTVDTPSQFVALKTSRSTTIRNTSSKCSGSSVSNTPAKNAGRYCSDPRNALDIAVGDIVNRMPMSVSVKPANVASFADLSLSRRSSTTKDLSGQYWIGDPEPRLCFCRILPSSTVMVRVGGGWQELSEFLTQHYAHLSGRGFQAEPAMLSTPGSSLTWLRSASGPVESGRPLPRSSVEWLRSQDLISSATQQQSARSVTMPSIRSRTISSTAGRLEAQNIPVATSKQRPTENRNRSFTDPCESCSLPSSGSGSSVIIHSPSLSLELGHDRSISGSRAGRFL